MDSLLSVALRSKGGFRDNARTLSVSNTAQSRRNSTSAGLDAYTDIYTDLYSGAISLTRPSGAKCVLIDASSTDGDPYRVAVSTEQGIQLGAGTSLISLSTSSTDALSFWTTSTSSIPITVRFF